MNNRYIGSIYAGLKRITALLLAVIMLMTSVQLGAGEFRVNAADAGNDELQIRYNGEKVTSVVVSEDEKIELTTEPIRRNSEYQWQIAVDRKAGAWVNISGQTDSTVSIGYAMIGSLLDASGSAYVRCKETRDGETYFSDPVRVEMSYVVRDNVGSAEYHAEGISVFAISGALRAGAQTPTTTALPGDYRSYTITINYLYFLTNEKAYDPFIAQIEEGGSYSHTEKFPVIVGYLAYFGDADESSLEYTVNVEHIDRNYEYYVYYKPTYVDFTIRHFVQNVRDDNYVLRLTTHDTGLTGSSVGDNRMIDIDGFTMLYYDKDVKIAADGSTEIEVYYDRNYYLVYFELGEDAYGTEPVYTRYESNVSANEPKRAGYIFDGWELIECGGVAATDEQKAQYKLETNGSVTVPSMNLKYKAKWRTAQTTYTVVYWTENADDNNYSFLTSAQFSAMSASRVNGADTPHTWDEGQHFTLDTDKSDKNIIVEGDGSTVVNVYYSRKSYTLIFAYTGSSNDPSGLDYNKLICTQDHTHEQKSNYRDTCYGAIRFQITAKYGQNIRTNFPLSVSNQSGTSWWWVPDNSVTYAKDTQVGSVDIMPGENVTYRYYVSRSGAPVYYYLQTLSGQSGTYSFQGRNYTLYKKVDLTTRIQLTYSEEFHPIVGFTQGAFKYGNENKTTPFYNGEDGRVDASRYGNYLLYYRNSYYIKYYNYNVQLENRPYLQYEATITSNYNITPAYPSTLAPDAFEFAGWYTTYDCLDGTEVKFDTMTMPAHDVELYAKWAPKKFRVNVYLNQTDIGVNDTIKTSWVDYNKLAYAPEEFSNGELRVQRLVLSGRWREKGVGFRQHEDNEKYRHLRRMEFKDSCHL